MLTRYTASSMKDFTKWVVCTILVLRISIVIPSEIQYILVYPPPPTHMLVRSHFLIFPFSPFPVLYKSLVNFMCLFVVSILSKGNLTVVRFL